MTHPGCVAVVVAVALISCARSSSGAQPSEWDTIKVPGGTGTFRCVADLPNRIPRARLLVELGRRFADSGPTDSLAIRLAAYATRLAAVEAGIAAIGGNAISLDDDAHRKQIDDLLQDLGIAVRRRGATATAEPRGQLGPDVDRLTTCLLGSRDDVARRLSARERVTILQEADEVPLPVSTRAWSALRKSESRLPLFLAIVADRDALVQYAALASLDREALALLAEPSAWRQVSDADGLLALYGGAFRIRDGTVDVAGGPSLAPAWEALVGQPSNQPLEFLRALLRADGGRLALFYALVDAFGPTRVRALLSERDAMNRLYHLFTEGPKWSPLEHPLGAQDFGVLTAAADIAIRADGSPLGPPSRQFWRVVLESRELPERPERSLKEEDPQPVTAGWLLDAVFGDPVYARERFAVVSFIQRVFPEAEVSPALVVAAIGSKQVPALIVGLERMGIRDPQIYADLVQYADRLKEGHIELVSTRLRQWQSAVGLVEALRRTGAINVSQAGAALAALAKWEPRRKGAFANTFGTWLDLNIRRVLPTPTGATPSDPAEFEQWLYQFISGPLRPANVRITWEGLTYGVDLASAHARRARAIARLEPRASLDDVLALIGVAAAAETAVKADAISAAVSDLQSRLPHFEQPLPQVPWLQPAKPIQAAEILKKVLKDLERVRIDQDVPNARRTAPTMWWLADELLADALPAVVYTGRLGATVGPPEKYADLWRRHDLGLGPSSEAVRKLGPWLIPEERGQASGAGVAGAFIGIDLALGRALLRQVAGGTLPPGTEVPPKLVAAIALSVALQAYTAGREGSTGGDLQQVANAIDRGRQRWASIAAVLASPDGRWPGALRLNTVAWMKNHEPAAIEREVSLTELFALGFADGEAPRDVFFGIPFAGRYGCWCLQFAPGLSMSGTGLWRLHSAVSDLPLRVAELLAELRMPAVLLPAVVAAAFADVAVRIDTVNPAEWQGVSDAVRLLTRDRLEQLVFSLVATRELTVATPSGKLP